MSLKRIKPPPASSPSVRRVMSANRGTGTGIEITLRKALWRASVRGYRVDWRIGRRRTDICFPRLRIAVFVHGCFWHMCSTCRPKLPKSHSDYWSAKLAQNRYRDQLTRNSLQGTGWTVLEIWEHEIAGNLAECVERVRDSIRLVEGLSLQGSHQSLDRWRPDSLN
jgi:DNA mismatch endonuclease (patch repair protein)